MLLSEAREILEDCWIDNGCMIDVTYYEDSSAWVATLFINKNGDDVEDVAEVRGYSRPTEAVAALEAVILQDDALLHRLERLG